MKIALILIGLFILSIPSSFIVLFALNILGRIIAKLIFVIPLYRKPLSKFFINGTPKKQNPTDYKKNEPYILIYIDSTVDKFLVLLQRFINCINTSITFRYITSHIASFKKQTCTRCEEYAKDDSPDVLPNNSNQKISDGIKNLGHNGTTVSQEVKGCQPKVNDTYSLSRLTGIVVWYTMLANGVESRHWRISVTIEFSE
jgi:hypothetical protein